MASSHDSGVTVDGCQASGSDADAASTATTTTSARKRPAPPSASDGATRKRFQDDVDDGGGGGPDGEAGKKRGSLVRQRTFTKADAQDTTHDAAAEKFFIPLERKQGEEGALTSQAASRRREVLQRRFANTRTASQTRKSSGDGSPADKGGGPSRSNKSGASRKRPSPATATNINEAERRAERQRRRADPAPPAPPAPPARQGTFTLDDDGNNEEDRDDQEEEEEGAVGVAGDADADTATSHSLSPSTAAVGEARPADEAHALVLAPSPNEGATAAELRAELALERGRVATLRRERTAAARALRAARERAARDAERTRAALQDLHQRLAATGEALREEKDRLHRKLNADFRRALHDREALWRQERDRALAQVHALESEQRNLRRQLDSVQAEAHRAVTAAEAELRRAFHDQEHALRAQIAELAKQRDSLHAQLRLRAAPPERPSSPASGGSLAQARRAKDEEWQRILRRERHDARRKQAQLEARLRDALDQLGRLQQQRGGAPTASQADLARAHHLKEQEQRAALAEAHKKHDSLQAQLRDALRALHALREERRTTTTTTRGRHDKKAAVNDNGEDAGEAALALESHGEGGRAGPGRARKRKHVEDDELGGEQRRRRRGAAPAKGGDEAANQRRDAPRLARELLAGLAASTQDDGDRRCLQRALQLLDAVKDATSVPAPSGKARTDDGDVPREAAAVEDEARATPVQSNQAVDEAEAADSLQESGVFEADSGDDGDDDDDGGELERGDGESTTYAATTKSELTMTTTTKWTCRNCSAEIDPLTQLPAGSLDEESQKLTETRRSLEDQAGQPKPAQPDARLLERVAALEREARDARDAADRLARRNRDLDEERCELEEAENDTRLRCQQLEVDLVRLRDREAALELELDRARRGLDAAQELQGRLENTLQSLETRNFELEEAECELRAGVGAVEAALPAIVAYHLTHYTTYLQARERRLLPSSAASFKRPRPRSKTAADAVVAATEVLDMRHKIAFLEQKESAFQETLAAADGLWSEMELDYKRRLARAEEAEADLLGKVRRLEDSEAKLRQALSELGRSNEALAERMLQLEALEQTLRARVRTLELEKKSIGAEADSLHEAARALQARVDGPLADELARERRRAQDLAAEVRSRQDALAALEERTAMEVSALRAQVAAGERARAALREEADAVGKAVAEAVSSLRAQLADARGRAERAERELFAAESALAARDQRLREQEAMPQLAPSALDEMAALVAVEDDDDDDVDHQRDEHPATTADIQLV